MTEGIHLAAAAMVIAALALCSAEDISRKQIRLWKTGFFIIANLVMAWCEQVDWKYMVSGIVLGIIFMAISICTEERIGKGDALLIMGAGSYLGFGVTLIVVFASLLLASGYGLFLVWKKGGWSHEIAFVPFMLVPYTTIVILQFCGETLA